MQLEMKLEACIKVLLKQQPLLGLLVHEMDRVETRNVPTMGVGFIDKDARIGLFYNPDFLKEMPEDVLIKIILPHELAHVINDHLARYSAEDYKHLTKRGLNIAMDMSINNSDYIDESLVPKANRHLHVMVQRENKKIAEELQQAVAEAQKRAAEAGDTESAHILEHEIPAMIREQSKIKRGDVKLVLPSDHGFEPKQTTDYYLLKLLEKYPPPPEGGCGEGEGDGEGNGEVPDNGFDSHKFGDSKLSKTTKSSLTRSALHEAYKKWANSGKHRGTTPNGVIETIEGMLFPKVPVAKAFRNLIGSFIGSDWLPSSSRINKRTGSYEIAGKRIREKLSLLLVIDTSGSMSTKELELFRGLIKNVQRELNPEIFIMHCDAEVQKVETLRGQIIPCDFQGRGGTDFSPAFHEAKKLRIKPDGVIFFTDGCGALEEGIADAFRVIWVITPGNNGMDFMNGKRMRTLKLEDCDVGA